MTLAEIKTRLKGGAIIEVTHYVRSVDRRLKIDSTSSRVTDIQWSKIVGLLVHFNSTFGGITTHYYKLKTS